MALTATGGTTTTDGTLQQLWSQNALKNYGFTLFLHNMALADVLQVTVSVYDDNGSALRVYKTTTYSDVQSDPAVYFPFVPTTQHKVQIKLLAGTNRAIPWTRYEA